MGSTAKIYGLQRSGNNWMMWMLPANYRVEILGNKKAGWTHGPIDRKKWAKTPSVIVLMVKHPISWLQSIYRFRGVGSFDEYIQESNEIKTWNESNRRWLDAIAEIELPSVVVRYEDALAKPENTLMQIAKAGGLERKDPYGELRMQDKWMGKHGQPTRMNFDVNYYAQRKYMSIPRRLVRYINARVDRNVMARLGYERAG